MKEKTELNILDKKSFYECKFEQAVELYIEELEEDIQREIFHLSWLRKVWLNSTEEVRLIIKECATTSKEILKQAEEELINV